MKKFFVLLSLAAGLVACSDDIYESEQGPDPRLKINLSGEIDQIYQTRAADSGFADGDKSGVFIVDYIGEQPGTLTLEDNRANNMRLTYNATEYKWNMEHDVYFKDDHTNIDVYGYYPYSLVTSVNAQPFEVSKSQNIETTDNALGGYEASDFLWGKAENIASTASVITLRYSHKMASAKITLVQGTGFAEGEWNDVKKQVAITNTKRNAEINLATGEVVAVGDVQEDAIVPYAKDDFFRAIVVPQTIAAGTDIFVFNVGNSRYTFNRAEALEFEAGKLHTFTFTVNKREEAGYEFTLSGESIVSWENDDITHDEALKEYIVIHVESPGQLEAALTAAGKQLSKVRNLKLTGTIGPYDFNVMRSKMSLQALNLKEVEIFEELGEAKTYNEIPNQAFYGNKTLTSIVLPDKLKRIGSQAFLNCTGLVGSLIIPEGVEYIWNNAFSGCSNLTGELVLPSTLLIIDQYAFQSTGFNCELKLPEGLKEIRNVAFSGCTKLYGELRLPESLSKIGSSAFSSCSGFTGSLTIPSGITAIPSTAFSGCTGLNGNLYLHDDILSIASSAFANCKFVGELNLPSHLKLIEESAFYGNLFSGELHLPSELEAIGKSAFYNNSRLTGTLKLPGLVVSIGDNAFYGCKGLEGIELPSKLETIGANAFYGCNGLGSVKVGSPIPPKITSTTFNGVPKDNFTVEVPEASVNLYKTSVGWMDFKRISAHHELVARPSFARALNAESTREIILEAEGAWSVISKPEWVSLSQESGIGKTQLALTVGSMSSGAGNRTGEVVFKLDDKDYTFTYKVEQYDYEYAENQIITLQSATKGNNGGINLVFLGDGYDAKDISNGTMLDNVREEVEYFFGIEPYATYRGYFNVYTAVALSHESGIGTVNTIKDVKFGTTFTGGVGLKGDEDAIIEYALNAPTVNEQNVNQLTVVMIPNSKDYGGITRMYGNGTAIAYCPLSASAYPYDSRGLVQHEAGGHAFGKLADEYIYHNTFIDACSCSDPHVAEFMRFKNLGWYANLSLSSKVDETGWSHLMFDSRYSDIVDIYEGGFMHARGVYRSELNSCMNNNIPYYSTISREAIVRRIKAYAGDTFDFEDFVAKDSKNPGVATRALSEGKIAPNTNHRAPVFISGSPLKNL